MLALADLVDVVGHQEDQLEQDLDVFEQDALFVDFEEVEGEDGEVLLWLAELGGLGAILWVLGLSEAPLAFVSGLVGGAVWECLVEFEVEVGV